ncbi:unnamed protein product [Pleuronectes platessa]|uniref:Uncharacterized protein n=1 Tax=Pleuronectes platessa TaxID=8262 RepID=A0A9N7U5F5_PLEPL|nr:unnamed protein product [Pleuronectes platessa]
MGHLSLGPQAVAGFVKPVATPLLEQESAALRNSCCNIWQSSPTSARTRLPPVFPCEDEATPAEEEQERASRTELSRRNTLGPAAPASLEVFPSVRRSGSSAGPCVEPEEGAAEEEEEEKEEEDEGSNAPCAAQTRHRLRCHRAPELGTRLGPRVTRDNFTQLHNYTTSTHQRGVPARDEPEGEAGISAS